MGECIMIRTKQTTNERVIDLTGPDGNAFSLMAEATNLAKQLNFNGKEIVEEMTTGDYENLISVFDKYFGDYVILEK
tara:strand:+ start:245 stop:475 length:231 start_codon:yes stop_codon:yes gene_type:complete